MVYLAVIGVLIPLKLIVTFKVLAPLIKASSGKVNGVPKSLTGSL